MTYLGASAAALATDRNTWQSRANQAWGASRVWNSGTSWESQAAANDAARATWQGRADQAWGASRVWSSGESWEQAYNRVLPPAAPITLSAAGGPNTGASGTMCSITVNRAGYWYFSFAGSWTGNSSDGPNSVTIVGHGGSGTANGDAAGSGNAGWNLGCCDTVPRLLSNGAVVSVNWTLGGGQIAGTLYAMFVPTQAYPR